MCVFRINKGNKVGSMLVSFSCIREKKGVGGLGFVNYALSKSWGQTGRMGMNVDG